MQVKLSTARRIERRCLLAVLPLLSAIRTATCVQMVSWIYSTRLLRSAGVDIKIKSGTVIDSPECLSVGDRFNIGEWSFISATGGMTIGNDVIIGHQVSLLTSNHGLARIDVPMVDQPSTFEPVVIGDDVWIGAGARVLAGVRIGRGAVVGANAVVTSDVPEFAIVVGIPARVLRMRGAEPAPTS